MFKKIRLKNGLRILFVPEKRTQTLTFLIMVKTGSKYEKKDEKGISHFLEHMCFKGTRKRRTPIEISEILDRVGGIYNASTSQELTCYWCKVKENFWNLALDWISDIFLNSTIPEEELEKEKGVILEELRMRKDHPMIFIEDLWYKLLYKDQPAGWMVIGEEKTIREMTREKILNYRNEQYRADNTILVVAGNFDEKKVKRKAEKYFKKLKAKKGRSEPEVLEEQKKPEILVEKRNVDQSHIILGFRGVNLFSRERYTQEILATILGGMMSSRLFVKIREKMGIAYYISTISEENPQTGFLATRAGLKTEKLFEGIKEILKEFKKIIKEGPDKEELKKAKENLKGKMAILLETSDAKATFYGTQEILEGEILTPKEVFKKIDSVSKNDILNYARKHFRPESLNLAVISPIGEIKNYQRTLSNSF